jgi:hypothetical protein
LKQNRFDLRPRCFLDAFSEPEKPTLEEPSMKNYASKLVVFFVILAACSLAVFGQSTSTGSLSGTVTDPKGELVAGATVVVRSNATGQEFTAETSGEGVFSIPSLASGMYTATITASGFKQAKVTEIKVDVGKPSSIVIALEIGSTSETVTVVGGGELLQTQTATIGTTLTGRQITDLPTASRDALDLVLALPGTATPGRPRTSSVNGLPKGALNITLDGINVQDNLLKSSDGFFTYIRPRTDAIAEVTTSTSTPGAESSAEGAVQIKFVTQGGSNEFHGGVYWYHRNPALNANYWFNNRDFAPDPVTLKAPQQRILLNQPGGKVGGPIIIPGLFNGRDKAFFFINYEEYRLPEKSPPRTRTILNPLAQAGIHRFNTTSSSYAAAPPANVTCGPAVAPQTGFTCSANVFTLAANAGLISTTDPTIGTLLGSIRSALTGVSAVFRDVAGSPNLQQATFFNPGGQVRKFPTVRFDFTVAKDHHIENIWNYQQFRSQVDFLNGVDPVFPGFPNFGSQDSNRFSNTTAWRWTINSNVVNEARFGLTGGTVLFFPQVNPSQFSNQGGVSLGIGAASITGATATTAPQRRNTPVKQFSDNLSWSTGNHSFNFGANFTRVNFWQQLITVVPTVNFGISSTLAGDSTAWNAFSSLQPTVSQQAAAAALYSTLAARISSITRNARLSEETNKYTLQGDLISRAQQSEYGIYAQDTWRLRPNFTLTGGLRWEVQMPFTPLNDTYARSTYEGLFGESGVGNLFKPGTLAGSPTTLVLFQKGSNAYEPRYDGFAPSVGFAWQPNFGNGFLGRLGGKPGQTVLRGGFSVAFNREGVNTFQNIYGSNAGGTISATQSITGTPFPLSIGNYFRSGLPAGPAIPSSPVYPNTGSISDGINDFLPNIKTGYVQSWTFSVQRELNPDNVIEVRYVGNRGKNLWRQYDLNEVNIYENGFLNEFRLAQANLLANINCLNNIPAGCTGGGLHFRYRGPGTGTFPLPIILGHFAGIPPSGAATVANYTLNATVTGLFSNTGLVSTLHPLSPSPVGFAGTLAAAANESLFAANRVAAGIPYNFFVVNPGKRGGSFLIDNSGATWYDAITVEFRRRLAKGFLVQSSYTFSKALANTYASASNVFDQPATLRDFGLRKQESPWDLTHNFKTNFIYELPIGRGRTWLSGANGWVDRIAGGWGINGNIRIQSGSAFSFGNVQLVGMTKKELQDAIGVYRGQRNSNGSPFSGEVYFLPEDIRLNTWRAFNIAFNGTGSSVPLGDKGQPVYSQGAPTGRYIAPAGSFNCMQGFPGECGFHNLILKGPAFFRYDLSLVKKIRFTERTNLELRAEALNAFNNINFFVGNPNNDTNAIGGFGTATFGRYTAAYQDISTTNDPGGRLIQLVLRFNF